MDRSAGRAIEIRSLNSEALEALVDEAVAGLTEEETLAALGNRFCTTRVCARIARETRLTSFHSVRVALVAHRLTPQAHALRLVHFLHWPELARLSADVRVPPAVRRAMETNLSNRIVKLTTGEKVALARTCSRELFDRLMADPSGRVFSALLINPRLVEADLVELIVSGRVTTEQITLLAADRKWISRYEIRRALVFNPGTPKGIAAAQLRFLLPADLDRLAVMPSTSVYLRLCIERMRT